MVSEEMDELVAQKEQVKANHVLRGRTQVHHKPAQKMVLAQLGRLGFLQRNLRTMM
jgi:hypothetical protein